MSVLEKAKAKKAKEEKPKEEDVFEELVEKPKKKEEVFVESPKEFSYEEYPVIALLWGADGTSKSEQIMKKEPREHTIIFDLEDKLRPQAAKLNFPQANIINAKKYNDKYAISGPKTLQGIRDILAQIRKDKQSNSGKFKDIELVAFDGISDIRKPYAVAEWLSEHPERVKPMNWGDWGEINDKVRDLCFTMINMGLVTNTNIVFTAQIDYKDEGEVPNCKPWIWHNIQHKFKMSRDDENKRFYAYCEKSFYDPFFLIDVTDWTHKEKPSLLDMLKNPETLEKYIELTKEEQQELTKKKTENLFG